MTDESKSQTEPWVARHEARYPYAYDKGGKLARFLGVRGIPHAVLLDPTGTIVWRGHPGSLEASTIKEHLAGALAYPLYEWPSSAKAVSKALVTEDLAGALEKARKLAPSDEHTRIRKQVESIIEGRVALTESQLEAGNFLDARDGAKSLDKASDLLDMGARLERVLTSIEASEIASDVIASQLKIRKIQRKAPTKRKDIDKAMDDLRKIVRSMPDSYAATEASAYMEQLRLQRRR